MSIKERLRGYWMVTLLIVCLTLGLMSFITLGFGWWVLTRLSLGLETFKKKLEGYYQNSS